MIIQPYVENAIIHGMKGKKEGGLISIVFCMKNSLLKISISDNGDGILKKINKHRRSFGMNITEKRLAYLESQSGVNHTIKSSSDHGTTITLTIKPLALE